MTFSLMPSSNTIGSVLPEAWKSRSCLAKFSLIRSVPSSFSFQALSVSLKSVAAWLVQSERRKRIQGAGGLTLIGRVLHAFLLQAGERQKVRHVSRAKIGADDEVDHRHRHAVRQTLVHSNVERRREPSGSRRARSGQVREQLLCPSRSRQLCACELFLFVRVFVRVAGVLLRALLCRLLRRFVLLLLRFR